VLLKKNLPLFLKLIISELLILNVLNQYIIKEIVHLLMPLLLFHLSKIDFVNKIMEELLFL